MSALGAALALVFGFVTVTVGATPASATSLPTSTSATATPSTAAAGTSIVVCATVTAGTLARSSGAAKHGKKVTARSPTGPTGTVTFTGPGALNQNATITSGVACFTSTTLVSGTITASYNGGAGFATSSGTVVVTITADGSQTTATATPATSVTGQSVVLCATVIIQDSLNLSRKARSRLQRFTPTATGIVTFTGAGTQGQTVALDGSGEACYTSTSLTSGTVTATYNGATGVTGSTNTVEVIVNQAQTTISVTETPNPSTANQTVTICATVAAVSPGGGAPTGTASFFLGATLLGTSTLSSGVGCFTTATLMTGTVSGVYTGDVGFMGSTGSDNMVVNAADTTTVVTATPDPSVVGQSVMICATVAVVAPGTATPTGTVYFAGPGMLNMPGGLDGNGVGCYNNSNLASGTVTATYEGDSRSAGSSGTLQVTVNPRSTTTVVTATPDPSFAGQTVTICATVTTVAPGSGTPTGTVTFTGPGALSATSAVNSGVACVDSTTLATGTVTATYNADSGFTTSTDTVAVTVGLLDTTTTLTATRTGASVELCAHVAASPPVARGARGRIETPSLTVTFGGLSGPDQTVALDEDGNACVTVDDVLGGTATATFDGGPGLTGSMDTASVDAWVLAPPSAPRNVVLVRGVSSMVASWDPPATGAPVTGYTVTVSPGLASCTTTTARTCLLGGTAGVTYTVTVIAHSEVGDSPPGEAENTAIPLAPATLPDPPATDLTLTTTDGHITAADPGQDVVFIGRGFLAYSTVAVTIYSDPIVLGRFTTNGAGNFRGPVTVPEVLTVGGHTVVAQGVAPDGTARAMAVDVTVGAVRPVTNPGDRLPATGPGITVLVLIGCAFVSTGGGLVTVSRRRPRRRLV